MSLFACSNTFEFNDEHCLVREMSTHGIRFYGDLEILPHPQSAPSNLKMMVSGNWLYFQEWLPIE